MNVDLPVDPSTPQFMSEDEIVSDFVAQIRSDPALLADWMTLKRSDLTMCHWGAALYIRNHYRLWDPENPHTKSFENQPDEMSNRIVEKVWKELHRTRKRKR